MTNPQETPLSICLPFILSHLRTHLNFQNSNRPFIIGLNGVQGIGKTTLVRVLSSVLNNQEGYPTLVASIDDFYLTREDQARLSEGGNKLWEQRGLPGTHDLPLLSSFLSSLLSQTRSQSLNSEPEMEPEQEPLYLPQYNKSAHAGKGDRAPRSTWPIVPRPLTVLILEGWCVGFKPLTEAELERRWREAQESLSSPATTTESQDSGRTKGLLARHELEHLRQVNDALSSYQAVLNDKFDIFIHLDIPTSPALEWVYTWRKEQESQLRLEKGPENAMTDEQVEKFVDGYMPAYELYLEGVRRGVFEGTNKRGRQLRIVLDRGRRVLGREVI